MKDIKIPRLPFIGYKESEKIARDILTEYGYIKIQKPPKFPVVDVEGLAFKSGHPLIILNDLRRIYDLKGMAYYQSANNNFEIIIDSDHYQYEERSSLFTIAEELAHIFIHAEIFEQIKTIQDRITFEEIITEQQRRIIEKQAKSVGSELLIPSSLFRPYILEWCKNNIKKLQEWRPINTNDLILFLKMELQGRLNLSHIIIERALYRETPFPIINEIIETLNITFLDDTKQVNQ